MIGKLLVLSILILAAVIGFEYYNQNFSANTAYVKVITTTKPIVVSEYHYYNLSTSITIYGNNTGSYIFPVSLPAYGNVSIIIISNSVYHLKIYNNQTLIGSFQGSYFNKELMAGGTLRLEFYNFSGEVSIQVSEIY